MEFKDLVRNRRSELGITLEEVGKIVGVSKATVQRWESGAIKNVRRDKIEKLAKALQISPAYLMDWEEAPQNEPKNVFPIEGAYVKVPVIGRVAAGLGCLADNEIVGYEYTDAEDINGAEDYRFLRVVGDSMYPKIEDGDLILVRSQTSVDSGSIAVVIIDDEDGVVKRVVYGKDFIELHSINPMYPVRRFENEDVLRVRVCGLVKQIKRKL
ncbi:MAG: LexA family protein [Hominilimicola sp.]